MHGIILKPYFFPISLICAVFLGGAFGYFGGEKVQLLKPLGDGFLHLILTAIVPLIFFSVSSAICKVSTVKKVGRLFFYMAFVFILMGLIAAILALIVVTIFPVGQGTSIVLAPFRNQPTPQVVSPFFELFTVTDFSTLFSHEHMLALIVFSVLVGLAASRDEKGGAFVGFLQSGEVVFTQVLSLIMYAAPLGFFFYFAVLIHELGPKILQHYLRVTGIYYGFAIAYFFLGFTLYSYLAGKKEGVRLFWKHVFLPTVTSLATCSSAASIPANLYATKKMKVLPEICETAIPLGALLHKEGSIIGGVIKIAFLFGLFHMTFSGLSVWLTALGVSFLVGTVMGAIPSGGMLGELVILSCYGFPSSVLITIAVISIIIDPLATLLNVTGNCVSSMLIARFMEGKHWFSKGPVMQAGFFKEKEENAIVVNQHTSLPTVAMDEAGLSRP